MSRSPEEYEARDLITEMKDHLGSEEEIPEWGETVLKSQIWMMRRMDITHGKGRFLKPALYSLGLGIAAGIGKWL